MNESPSPRETAGDPLQALLDEQTQPLRAQLGEAGQVVEESGTFQVANLCGSLHTDLGPAGQDKDVNQDYALAWIAKDDAFPLKLAVALADGLTSSYASEWAARLACWQALATLHELYQPPNTIPETTQAEDLARQVFSAIGQALVQFYEEVAREADKYRPEGFFPSTWRYVLRRKALLETTTSLLWVAGGRVYVAVLGDGGLLWRSRLAERPPPEPNSPPSHLGRCLSEIPGMGNRLGGAEEIPKPVESEAPPSRDFLFVGSKDETYEVQALGPACPQVEKLECCRKFSLDELRLAALFTDGIGRGICQNSRLLLDELEDLLRSACSPEMSLAQPMNAAQQIIERYKKDRPAAFLDNLTLVVIYNSAELGNPGTDAPCPQTTSA